jgi:phosphoglucosamine mutase
MRLYFGTDGIRGTVGEPPLAPEFFLKLGRVVGAILNPGREHVRMIIGRDTRQSGQLLQNALTAGLLSSGVDVIDVGVFPTAGIAWLIRRLGLKAGAVLSASHNPTEQNGIKFIDAAGYKFSELLEENIEAMLLDDEVVKNLPFSARLGQSIDGRPYQDLYIQGLVEEHQPDFLRGLTLLVDCSNGAASDFAPKVFSRAGARVIALHATPDGTNINAGCGSEFVRRAPWEMGKWIEHYRADFGLAFDGDADRVVFVDENGQLIDGDHMLGFLARYLESKGRLMGRTVVTTTMRNHGLKSFLEKLGIQVFETPVGDKYVVEKLVELRQQSVDQESFCLGGEQAGHIDILNDEFTTGDGIRTALYVMRAFLESGLPVLSQFAAGIGKTPQIIASAYVGPGRRYDRLRLAEMEAHLQEDFPGLQRVNLRYSGTEPLFRAMLEADERMSELELARAAWTICRSAQQFAGVENGSIDILNCTNGGVIRPADDW